MRTSNLHHVRSTKELKDMPEKLGRKKGLLGGGRVLGNGLGALGHGVLGKLTREDQPD